MLAVTGIDVFILFLGAVIPPLRDSVPQERDSESPQTINVKINKMCVIIVPRPQCHACIVLICF